MHCNNTDTHCVASRQSLTGTVKQMLPPTNHLSRWALMTIRECLSADWDPALLEHEMAEEVAMEHEDARVPSGAQGPCYSGLVAHSESGPVHQIRASPAQTTQLLPIGHWWSPAATKTVLFRGLRLRVRLQ